ncbi:MAG TPA: D-glycero-beta-D-manno-heptose 1,7-bisphosphate 7-phosphatase [Herpetosiphonaceae bacterium]
MAVGEHSGSARRAIFLDRDGTLNVEVNYLHRIEDLVLVPGAAEAVRSLSEAGFLVVVVTNQAGIARGYYDEAALHTLHEEIQRRLAAEGGRIDAFYFCPHHPEFGGVCECRKPAPGMLRQAAHDHGIDLHRSWLIGDTSGDIGAGHAVGCRTILVRSGYGAQAEAALGSGGAPRPEAIVADLRAAAAYVLAHDRG